METSSLLEHQGRGTRLKWYNNQKARFGQQSIWRVSTDNKKARHWVPKSPTSYALTKCSRKISTFKDHFKAILVGINKNFPMHLWDRLLAQAESMLNMLWLTNIATKILACAYMYGQHDFNKMPLAPMGCAVHMHNKPAVQKTWDDHASEGYYTETSREHYWCYKIWTKKTRSIQSADTIVFKHQYITTPTVTKADAIVAMANKLTQVLQEETENNIGVTEKWKLTQ